MKTKKYISYVIFFYLLCVIWAVNATAQTTTIMVLQQVEIVNDKVLLGKIADINGADPELVKKLRSIVIARAPMPGKSIRIDENYINRRLKQNNIDLSEIILKVPETSKVCRSSLVVPREKIKKIALDYIYKNIPWDRNRVNVKNIRVSRNVILPKGNVTYKVILPKNNDLLGNVPLSVIFMVDGQFQEKVWAMADIEVSAEAVVTKRPLGRYQPIRREDLYYKKVDLADLPSGGITSIEEVLGKRARRTIYANVVLRSDLIELPPLVRRRDTVLIIAESDNLKITTFGEVKEKGYRGDRIRILNLDSKKEIYARVLDSNTVKVDF